jgi:hypothetical protein
MKFDGTKLKVSRIISPLPGQVMFRVHKISSIPLHWLIMSASLPYLNHDKYDSHVKYGGTEAAFKKKPPKIRKGIIIGGAMDSAIEMEELAQEIKYPNDVDTFAMRHTIPTAMKKYDQPARKPIMG